MPRRGHRPRAARSHVARLVVLAALFAGFAIAFGVHCAEMTSSGKSDTAMVAPDASGKHVADAADHDDGTDGLLMTCLVFFVAVVAAVAGLRPRQRSSTPIARASPSRVTFSRLLPRGPRLADLCISRT